MKAIVLHATANTKTARPASAPRVDPMIALAVVIAVMVIINLIIGFLAPNYGGLFLIPLNIWITWTFMFPCFVNLIRTSWKG